MKFIKPLIISVLIGVLEIMLVVQLHQSFSLWELIALYLATTLVGVVLVTRMGYRHDEQYALGKKAQKRVMNKLKSQEPLTEKESHQAMHILTEIIFLLALILVILPGLLTDVFGLLMVLPFSVNWIKKRMMLSMTQAKPSPPLH
ncbi:MAG: FxsA family protein [Marinicella sp.]